MEKQNQRGVVIYPGHPTKPNLYPGAPSQLHVLRVDAAFTPITPVKAAKRFFGV